MLEQDDAGGVARAWRSLMIIHGTTGRLEDATTAAEAVVEHADRADDPRIGGRGVMGYVSCATYSRRAVAEAMPRCEAFLARVRGDRTSEATVWAALAQLTAMSGDLGRAHEMAQQYRATLLELGPSVSGASTSLETSRVDLLAGDPEAAERDLQRDYDDLGRLGERYFRSTIGSFLARVMAIRGRSQEAADLASEVGELADPEDFATQITWRLARSRALAQLGDAPGARALAEEALRLADDAPEYIVVLADAYADVGDIQDVLGDREAARAAWSRALECATIKGDVVTTAAMQERLGR
jgi:tetratricopeptide (TPR) repeat protein